LHDLPAQLDEIRGSLAARDYTAIGQHAHRAKGTSGTYHLDSIAEMFADLEQIAEKRNPNDIAETLSRIGSLVELETEKLSRSMASLPDRPERNTDG
jgi:HPt (histidine-containing phosphotransfer) domain-containing protein